MLGPGKGPTIGCCQYDALNLYLLTSLDEDAEAGAATHRLHR